MSVEEGKQSSLLHGISINNKGKLVWTKSYPELQMFVEEVLNLSDGEWGNPGGDAKQFKSKAVDMRWYPESQSITLNGKLKDELRMKLVTLAGISEQLANENKSGGEASSGLIDNPEGNDGCDTSVQNASMNSKEISTNVDENTILSPAYTIRDDHTLSLEALQNQIQALTKEVNGNTAALKNIRETKMDSNPLLVQESKNEVDRLKEKIYKLMDENKHLKNENNENIQRINNLSFILADLQQKTKNAEQERDSVITAMRLLIADANGVAENNASEQKLCNEVDECTQSKDIIVENNASEQKIVQ